MALATTVTTRLYEKPFIMIPRVVPTAGGCSKSKTTIIKIEIPIAIEYILIEAKKEEVDINENREPKMAPTRCPPITFLCFAVTLSGLAKTI